MAHEEHVFDIMKRLRIATKHQVAQVMAHRGFYKPGVSAVNNTNQTLTNLSETGKVIKERNYYRMPDSKSKFADHARILTDTLIQFLKLPYDTQILREYTIEEVGLRPDALVFISKNGKGACAIVEVCRDETENYLTGKINVWRQWSEAAGYLTKLFGYWVRHFDIVVEGKDHPETFTLKRYLEVLNG